MGTGRDNIPGKENRQEKQNFETEGNKKDPRNDSVDKENTYPKKKKLKNSHKNINIKQLLNEQFGFEL